jgi:hypothetical protein
MRTKGYNLLSVFDKLPSTSNNRGGWNKCGGWDFLEKTST